MEAVKFDHYGDIDVLEVREVPRPSPGPGEVQVGVKAAGINPGEAMIRKGALHDHWPATFPKSHSLRRRVMLILVMCRLSPIDAAEIF